MIFVAARVSPLLWNARKTIAELLPTAERGTREEPVRTSSSSLPRSILSNEDQSEKKCSIILKTSSRGSRAQLGSTSGLSHCCFQRLWAHTAFEVFEMSQF